MCSILCDVQLWHDEIKDFGEQDENKLEQLRDVTHPHTHTNTI